MDRLGLSGEMGLVLPHPYKLAHRFRGRLSIWRGLIEVLSRLWWAVGFPVWTSRELAYFVRRMVRSRDVTQVPLTGSIIVATSHRIADLAPRLSRSARPHKWLTVPWVSLESKTLPADDVKIPFESLIQWRDILGALRDSWVGSREFSRDRPRPDRLFTYTAFRWFLFRRVVLREGCALTAIWFANHYDRWAVLLDHLPFPADRIMIQHGLIDALEVPTRLKAVSRFYCFDDRSASLFRRYVFGPGQAVETTRIPASIDLKSLPDRLSDKRTILVIGQPIDYGKELRIVKALLDLPGGLHVLIKPHPLSSAAPYYQIRHERYMVIEDELYYPAVELVVCGSSTLGLEYEASGVHVLWHDGIKKLSAEEVANQVAMWGAGRNVPTRRGSK